MQINLEKNLMDVILIGQ